MFSNGLIPQNSERSALRMQLETLNDQLVRSAKQTEDWENDANRLAQVHYLLLRAETHTYLDASAVDGL